MIIRMLLFAALLSIAGCMGQTTLDATSMQTVNASVDRMNDGLSAEGAKALKQALALVVNVQGMPTLSETQGSPEAVGRTLYKPLHGMTAEEILAKADEIRAEYAAKKKAQKLGKK